VLRTFITLMLVAMQGLLSAPLYVCTSARGEVRLDGGSATCVACQPTKAGHNCGHDHTSCCSAEDDSYQQVPCDCRHDPLSVESQQVRRSAAVPSGELLVAPIALPSGSEFVGGQALALCHVAPAGSSHTPLADLAAVCLRC